MCVVVFVIPFSVVITWFALRWVLGPLDRAAKNQPYPVQFTLADFLCLFVEVQLTLAGPSLAFGTMQDKSPAIGVTVALTATVLLVWWTGVRTLSRAGVHGTAGRAFTLIAAIPLGFAAAIALPLLAIAIGLSFVEPRSEIPAALLGLIGIALVLLVAGLGFAIRRILASANRRRQMPPSDTASPPI